MRLEGKIAVITGGASGIGEAAVRIFVENGATVIIADVQNEAGEQLAASLAPSTAFVHCDVSKESDVSSAVDYAVEKYGRLDIMFSNAGVPGKLFPSPADITLEDLDRVLAVNVRGSYLCTKHAARVMIPNRRGCILYTSSLSSIVAMPNGPSYTASKHAIVGLMKSAAAALAPYGIRANCVSPTAWPPPWWSMAFGATSPVLTRRPPRICMRLFLSSKGPSLSLRMLLDLLFFFVARMLAISVAITW